MKLPVANYQTWTSSDFGELRRAVEPLPVSARSRRARGFSFTEILFAVMILGIGFIMVAAMFPVAISQTQSNSREAVGASIARTGFGYMEKLAATNYPAYAVAPQQPKSILIPTFTTPYATQIQQAYANYTTNQPTFDVPGQVWSVRLNPDNDINAQVTQAYAWNAIAGNLILADDPRYAWVAMVKRDLIAPVDPTTMKPDYSKITSAPQAQIILIAVQAGASGAYVPPSPTNPNNVGVDTVAHPPALATLEPELLTATLTPPSTPDGGSFINFTSGNIGRVAEGCYVVIADDKLPPYSAPNVPARGQYNGRIYRVGTLQPGSTTSWQLRPGSDLTAADPVMTNAAVYVVGRGYDPSSVPPKSVVNQFSGPAQDITAYTTFVSVPN